MTSTTSTTTMTKTATLTSSIESSFHKNRFFTNFPFFLSGEHSFHPFVTIETDSIKFMALKEIKSYNCKIEAVSMTLSFDSHTKNEIFIKIHPLANFLSTLQHRQAILTLPIRQRKVLEKTFYSPLHVVTDNRKCKTSNLFCTWWASKMVKSGYSSG